MQHAVLLLDQLGNQKMIHRRKAFIRKYVEKKIFIRQFYKTKLECRGFF